MAPSRSACQNGQITARNSADRASTRRRTKAMWKCCPLLLTGSINVAPRRLERPTVTMVHGRGGNTRGTPLEGKILAPEIAEVPGQTDRASSPYSDNVR